MYERASAIVFRLFVCLFADVGRRPTASIDRDRATDALHPLRRAVRGMGAFTLSEDVDAPAPRTPRSPRARGVLTSSGGTRAVLALAGLDAPEGANLGLTEAACRRLLKSQK